MLTREYPPEVYGGAGVHVEYLARSLAGLVDLTVHCQGADRPDAVAHRPWPLLAQANQSLQVISADLSMAAATANADVVHSHTWYTSLAGHLSALLHGIPHVLTAHSLEPLRPWKAEQLGGGYAVSSWCERTAIESAAAIIAVSRGMRADILMTYPNVRPGRVHVIHNGIDAQQYAPDHDTAVLARYGIDPGRPSVVFVGRVTRQKGLQVLLRAATRLDPQAQLVLCAGQADTPELQAEVSALAQRLRATRSGVIWIPGMLAKPEVIQILSHADGVRLPFAVRAARDREPGGDGLRHCRGGLGRRRHPGGSGCRGGPGCWSRPMTMWPWPRRSTRCSLTRPGPRSTAPPDGRGQSPSSAGTRSPRRRRSCTRAWPAALAEGGRHSLTNSPARRQAVPVS